MLNVKKGQRVWLHEQRYGSVKGGGLEEVTVSRVGRKFIYLEERTGRWRIRDGARDQLGSAYSKVYASRQEYDGMVEYGEKHREIIRRLEHGDKIPLDTLRTVHAVMFPEKDSQTPPAPCPQG